MSEFARLMGKRGVGAGRLALALSLGLSLSLALSGCDDKKEALPKLTYDGPMMETENVLQLFTDSARLQIKLTAPLQQLFENGDEVWKKGVQVAFYAKDGSVKSTLAANYGKLDKAKNTYIMRGNVRIENPVKREKLHTEELFYDRAKGEVYADSTMFVTITTPYEQLTGYGMKAAQDLSRYSFHRPTGVFALEAK